MDSRFDHESLKGGMTTTGYGSGCTPTDSVDLSNDPHQPIKIRARIVPSTDLEMCGERLRNGELVAFPTETVYGLGCNALDVNAIIKVFEAKERPLTDPLITHVTQNQVAYELWQATSVHDGPSSSLEGRALRALVERFWPGPLTLVATAAPRVPSILMANTGFVACRSPQHPIAIALIEAARVPIAAPSANKFGHVSPTRSHHVWDDLKYENVWIVKESNDEGNNNDDDDDSNKEREKAGACRVGVESSVAKIEMIIADNNDDNKNSDGAANRNRRGRITLLRQGAVSVQDIQDCLDEAGLVDDFVVLRRTKKATDETVAHVAPGQTIRHYSPHIPSFVMSSHSRYIQVPAASDSPPYILSDNEKRALSTTVVIDFGGKLKLFESFSLSYRDLSVTGDSVEASNRVFDILRWAELVDSATQILFPEIVDEEEDVDGSHTPSSDALTLALKDRLTRAASGVVIERLTPDQ
jgi:L-threonylcarbamoyladenylate synthase